MSIVTDPDTGDNFVVRRCDDCDGVVIEHYLCVAGRGIGDEPTHTVDVPPGLIGWLSIAVAAFKRDIDPEAKR